MAALLKETGLRNNYLGAETVETIYFGGGTPSLLQIADLKSLLDKIRETFTVSEEAEITLEANPDDITEEKLVRWKEAGINRLSIGVQSFFEEDLLWMNRAHNARQAIDNLQLAIQHFDNITIDLIYGHPLLTNEKWKDNVERIIQLRIPHISCYALTVEPKTPLHKLIQEKKKEDVRQEQQAGQFLLLIEWLEKAGYDHYEISNFSKPGFRSRHNTSYWQGKKYLGLGPSAHSFDGESRQWNISNNPVYIESLLAKNIVPFEKETLTPVQRINEYIMTSLRTMDGMDLGKLSSGFGIQLSEFKTKSQKFIQSGEMVLTEDKLQLTNKGKLFADGIASELFVDEL